MQSVLLVHGSPSVFNTASKQKQFEANVRSSCFRDQQVVLAAEAVLLAPTLQVQKIK
jgi:hypothetical protein